VSCNSAAILICRPKLPMFEELGIEDWFERCVCAAGVPQCSRKKDSALPHTFICSVSTKLSLSNAHSITYNLLIIAKNELERMWNTLLIRMVVILADSETAPLNTYQKLYRVSHLTQHFKRDHIDSHLTRYVKRGRIHNHIAGLVSQHPYP
jgi:hypothetical protein